MDGKKEPYSPGMAAFGWLVVMNLAAWVPMFIAGVLLGIGMQVVGYGVILLTFVIQWFILRHALRKAIFVTRKEQAAPPATT